MHNSSALFITRILPIFIATILTGCGQITTTGINTGSGTTASTPQPALHGRVHGGQQPVVGSQVYLYAAGSGGYGSAARSMLAAPGYVTTDSSGSFSITGRYSCQAGDLVYALALGGNAGGGSNNNIAMMTALGPCSTLLANAASTFIYINEVTTVASVYALSPYIAAPQNIGAPASDLTGLTTAFAAVDSMVDTSTGTAFTAPPATPGTVPQSAINSLANSIASCINSTGSFSTCITLYTVTTYAGSVPSDTIAATLSVARHPLNNAGAIYSLASAAPPFQPTLSAPPANWSFAVAYAGDVLTYHNDSSRTGFQTTETILTPANVNSTTFGLLYMFPVDGWLYAQPLGVTHFLMSDGAFHNVAFASTSHASIYAFDADNNNPAQGYLWQKQLVGPGEEVVNAVDYSCHNPDPETGIIGTPVIDRTTGTLYVVSKTKLTSGGNTTFYQRLHALNLADGSEKFGGPTVITASVPGTGDGAQGGTVTFNALRQNQRSALLLDNGTVWIVWASHCDIGPYHGWVLGYNAANITQQTAVYNNTPNGSDGGIWMGIGGPSSDPYGNIFVVGGNGTFDADTGGPDLGDAALRIPSPTGASTTLTAADYFVPSNQEMLSGRDLDVGDSDALLFHDPGSAVAPNLAVMTDKTGRLYLLNQSNLGKYDTGSNGPDSKNGDLQDFTIGDAFYNNFAWLPSATGGTMFIGANDVPLGAYPYIPGTSNSAGSLNTTPTSQTAFTFYGGGGNGGTAPALSANGSSNPILWTLDRSTGNTLLFAFDATNLANQFYNSTQASGGRDLGPAPVKFSSPVIAHGKVFVSGTNALAVYGLLP